MSVSNALQQRIQRACSKVIKRIVSCMPVKSNNAAFNNVAKNLEELDASVNTVSSRLAKFKNVA